MHRSMRASHSCSSSCSSLISLALILRNISVTHAASCFTMPLTLVPSPGGAALTVYFANTEHQSRGLLHCPMQLKPDVVERRFHNWRSWAVRTPNARPFIIPLPHPLLPPVTILRHTSLTQLVCPGRRQADANILVGAGLSSCACCTSNFCAVELRVLRRLHQRINPLANVPFAGHVHVQSASAGPCTEVGF